MRFRKLRIAWSVIWGLAAVLLIVLWVRSEHHFDAVDSVMSAQGRLYLFPKVNVFPTGDRDATVENYDHLHGAVTTIVAWNVQVTPAPGTGPIIPFWVPVFVLTLIAITPWLPQQFSLGSLLIATTLVAVVLGLAVYTVRE
jgi:hypothetical protein